MFHLRTLVVGKETKGLLFDEGSTFFFQKKMFWYALCVDINSLRLVLAVNVDHFNLISTVK